MQKPGESKTKFDRIAVITYGPKAVGDAQLLKAYFLGKAKPQYDAKRTSDVVDIVIGAEYQQLATSTEVNQSLVELGEPELPPGACAAPAHEGRQRRAVARRSRPAGRVQLGQQRRAARRTAPAAPRSACPCPAGSPSSPDTRSPASVATRPPAAWSHGFRPFSKYASTMPSAAMHRSRAAAPNRRMSRTRVISPASTAPWCARRAGS